MPPNRRCQISADVRRTRKDDVENPLENAIVEKKAESLSHFRLIECDDLTTKLKDDTRRVSIPNGSEELSWNEKFKNKRVSYPMDRNPTQNQIPANKTKENFLDKNKTTAGTHIDKIISGSYVLYEIPLEVALNKLVSKLTSMGIEMLNLTKSLMEKRERIMLLRSINLREFEKVGDNILLNARMLYEVSNADMEPYQWYARLEDVSIWLGNVEQRLEKLLNEYFSTWRPLEVERMWKIVRQLEIIKRAVEAIANGKTLPAGTFDICK